MSPKTRQSLAVAAAVVAFAAIAGIATIEGWIPASFTADTPASDAAPGLRVAGTAPPESLSPGESIVPEADAARAAKPQAPAAAEPAPAPRSVEPPKPAEPARKPAPQKPVYAQSPSSARDPQRGPPSRALCANCGTVASTTLHEDSRDDIAWEVRVRFDDGTRRVLRFPTDPGFRVGDRVFLSNGRLRRG